MRTRFILSALAALGLSAGSALAQAQPGPVPPPGNSPPTNVPDNTPPGARPATGPATQPDNTPRDAPKGTGPATQPDNTPPGSTPVPRTPPPVATPGPVIGSGGTGVGVSGTTTTGGIAAGSTGTTTAPVAIPPELAKLEAQAAVEIPSPAVPAGKAPEAKRVAEAAVKVRRATWVVEKLIPPPPEGVAVLNFNTLKVGSRGWVDTTADVVRTADGVSVIRPSGFASESVVLGVPAAADAATAKTVSLRGEYVVDRAVTLDGREVLVLKEVAAAKALDDAVARLISAARARLEEAKAQYSNAVAVLVAAKKKAVDAALARTQAEAARQIPVPDNATGEERIKAKKDQDELAQKLAKPDLDKIAEMYGDVPAVSPTRQ